jgi:preprotein translocase subunit SecG
MVIVLTIFHVICCFFLIVVVLLQSGKAADLAGAFGGMGSQTAFGPRGAATLLSKATTIAAGVFMLTSLSLSIMATRSGSTAGGSTVLEKTTQGAPAKKDATKAGQPATAPINIQTPGGSTTVNVPLAPEAPAKAPAAPAKK